MTARVKAVATVAELPASWEEVAGMIEAYDTPGEGGKIADSRAAATLRTCAAGLRAVLAREPA